jgi:hypothetical protein
MLSPDEAGRRRLAASRETDSSKRRSASTSSCSCEEYASLLKVTDRLTFERHRIDYDRTGRYDPLNDSEFPLCIRLFNYRHNDFTAAMTWHDHLGRAYRVS